MRSTRLKGQMIALLTFVLVASSFSVVSPAQAGPISDMIARHRQAKQMKLPPVEKPFSKKPVKDLNAQNASFSTRLKKRFSLKKDGPTNSPLFQDSNVTKTSR
jgi:hypothetical protein